MVLTEQKCKGCGTKYVDHKMNKVCRRCEINQFWIDERKRTQNVRNENSKLKNDIIQAKKKPIHPYWMKVKETNFSMTLEEKNRILNIVRDNNLEPVVMITWGMNSG